MRRWPILVAFVVLFAAGPQPARGDLASMVADLAAEAGPNRGSYPESFTRVGSRVVFFARDGDDGGSYPWATDGTRAGTVRLPGSDSFAVGLGNLGGAYLWIGLSTGAEAGVYSLWRSSGEAAGTARLAEGVYAPREGSPIPWALTADRLYFFRRTGVFELWESDGTAAGTRRIASLPQLADRDEIFAVASFGGGVFFLSAEVFTIIGGEPSYGNVILWRTDRTSGRTRSLYGDVGAFALYPTADRLLFLSTAGVWATDGTPRGTVPLPGPPGEADFEVTWIGGTSGGKLYFGGHDPLGGDALWVSDGTGPGTRLLAPGLTFGFGFPGVLPLGDRTFFVAADAAHGVELWSTRGTPATTARVVDLCPGSCSAFADPFPYGPSLAVAGGQVFMLASDGVHGTDLWVSDGTAAGTRRVLDLDFGGPGDVGRLRPEGDEVFFYQRDAAGTVTLWGSDGTPEGTRRLTDFSGADPFSASPSLPAPSLAALGPWIVTTGYDPRGGFEPWALRRNGWGGRPLGDLATAGDAAGSFPVPFQPFDAVALGDRLLFVTGLFDSPVAWSTRGSPETTVELGEVPQGHGLPVTGAAGGVGYLNRGDLWGTDGTPAGTVPLTDFAATAPGSGVSTAIVDLGGRAVFGVTAGNGQTTKLWTSDGTAGGTRPAGPPSAPLPSFPQRIRYLTAVGGDLYFWADDGQSGWEIWTADAALTALTRLTDRDPADPDPHGESGFTRIGDHVYFLGSGVGLWRTDGTAQGTEPVPPPPVGANASWRALLGAGASVLLLFSDSDNSHPRLFAGDGSGTDWAEIRDFGPNSFSLGVVPRGDDALILVNEQGSPEGPLLYRTDGTAAGTAVAIDFARLGVGRVAAVTPVAGRLFFAAGPPGGTELWVSDGTQEGTRRLQEIAPGPGGSEPGPFTVAGSRLYFPADDGLHGRELWSLPLTEPPLPCRPSATALCLGDGRFRAELFLHDRTGRRGDGRAVAWSSTSGAFWLYGYGNPEAAVKMVDGGAVNGRYWVFYGPLGDAYAALTVTDLASGDSRRYPPDPGPLPAFAHVGAFPSPPSAGAGEPEAENACRPAALFAAEPASLTALESSDAPESAELPASFAEAAVAVQPMANSAALSPRGAGACQPTATRLCLVGGRFAVDLVWRDVAGGEHPARAFAHGDGAGYFAFYGARDVQAALKILDGRPINGRFWLFATSLTHLGYTLTVTDTATGAVHSYLKPLGEISSLIDLSSLG
jgi:ELWxxDGT repeat protein